MMASAMYDGDGGNTATAGNWGPGWHKAVHSVMALEQRTRCEMTCCCTAGTACPQVLEAHQRHCSHFERHTLVSLCCRALLQADLSKVPGKMATQWRRTGSGCMLHRHAADDGDGDAEHESFAGDLVLKVGDAHTLRAHSALLAMASRPLANALRCGSCSASGPACLEVQGAPEGWRQLLRFLLHPGACRKDCQVTREELLQC